MIIWVSLSQDRHIWEKALGNSAAASSNQVCLAILWQSGFAKVKSSIADQ